MTGFICGPRIYKYKGVAFEYGHFGPGFHRKDGGIMERVPRGHWGALYEWLDLSEDEREEYRVGGGCERI